MEQTEALNGEGDGKVAMTDHMVVLGSIPDMGKKKHIGKLLREARLRRKLTAEELGRRCNVSRSRIYAWERERYVSRKNIQSLAKALRIAKAKLEAENLAKR